MAHGQQQRTELHRTIWEIAEDLRNSIDGWDFKQYVLGGLFYRYISENFAHYIDAGEHAAGFPDFRYALLSDEEAETTREDMVETKGFFILPSELFENVVKRAADDSNLNETLKSIFDNIIASSIGEESHESLSGLFDDFDVNSNKLGKGVTERNERLTKLLKGIERMNLGGFQDNSIDAFGDAYEYLMTMYASKAGKSGGEFFTPQDVSELIARITVAGKTSVNKVYDPACGSGSLLLKFSKVLGKENVLQGFYGQEINLTTYNLCRINMFLHDIPYEKFSVSYGDTLMNPSEDHRYEEPFEAIVSNPPYSTKWAGNTDVNLINDARFAPAGVLAPNTKADFAFIMHSLAWLAPSGTAAIVSFPGILYRGGDEKKIRQYLVDGNYVDAIIQLPPNLFFGTSIATCIFVMKKSKTDSDTLFINASKEFAKTGNTNTLMPENIERILGWYEDRQSVDHVARLVSSEEIAEHHYDLSPSTYIEAEDTREVIDIQMVNSELEEIVEQSNLLRAEIELIVADMEGTDVE